MPKKYNILLSAYACEPNRGSEQGVGWHWALEISNRGHNVWVLTRRSNSTEIESYFEQVKKPDNLHFIYYDVPKWISFWKKGNRGVHLYYLLWQIGIVGIASRANKKYKFDFVHHITFVTIHLPSFLFLLKNVSFFYGPCAGGDLVPIRFLNSFPFRIRLKELLHYLQNNLLVFDPVRCWMFRNSDLIFCNSPQTLSFLPKKQLPKTRLNLAIGTSLTNNLAAIKQTQGSFQILFVGMFNYWKGIHLVIKAFNHISGKIQAQLTLIGKAGDLKNIETIPGYSNDIKCISWMPQDKILEIYRNYDLMLFPSFRDSGGMVVLESLANGLPVICLDYGGPGQIVNNECGRVIDAENKSEQDVVSAIADTLIELQQTPETLKKLKEGAVIRASEYTWEKVVANVYNEIEEFMSSKKVNL